MLRLCALALVVACCGAGVPATASVLYVDDDAAPGGNGTSWERAYTYLRDALAAAGSGTEIRIAQGIYRPDRTAAIPGGSGSRTDRFQINNGVVVRGGYAGISAPNPDARDIAAYETVLSGDLAGNDQPGFVGMDENSYKVVYLYYGAPGTLLEGVTIRGGNANRTSIPFDLRGGGLYCLGGEPTISRCTFTANSAGKSGQPEGNGGAMYVVTGPAHVEQCRFVRNAALGNGASIYVNQIGSVIQDCVFEENAGGNGGGIGTLAASPRVVRCTFTGNSATQFGGGVNTTGGSAVIEECVFDGNRCGHSGGGLNAYGNVTVTDSQFVRNQSDGYGAGVYNSSTGGSPSNLLLAGCLFAGNLGTAVDNWPGAGSDVHATLRNCTLVGNGTGVFDAYGIRPSELTSCVLWDNGGAEEWWQLSGEAFMVNYCCVQGWTGGFGGTGNFGDDPRLVDAAGGDFRLRVGSPCIETGDPAAVYTPGVLDLDGNVRVWDGDADGAARIDIGVYEYGSHSYGDLNCDGSVNVFDIDPFVLALTSPDEYAATYVGCSGDLADANADGAVNTFDIDPFVGILVGAR